MWLLALAAIARRRRTLGRVAIPALLAFSPFVILLAQSYGGEAIYRVYMFSAPWCALLIAWALCELRAPLWRWLCIVVICALALFAGLQGLYGPARVYAFTPAELASSLWLYGHVPYDSLIVLPIDDFPQMEAYDYNAFNVERLPADVQLDVSPWMDEANLGEVETWVASLDMRTAYVVFSRSMAFYADFFGAPPGSLELEQVIATAPGSSLVYSNADVKIYRLDVATAPPPAAVPRPTAATLTLRRAEALFQSGRYTEAQALLQRITSRVPSAETTRLTASISPAAAAVLLLVGADQAFAAHHWRLAGVDASGVLFRYPRCGPAATLAAEAARRLRAKPLVVRAVALAAARRWTTALADDRRALHIDPSYPGAAALYARIHSTLARQRAAAKASTPAATP